MMEKYGVDMSELPPTDEQLKHIAELSKQLNIDYGFPNNRKEAEELIQKMLKEGK